VDPGFRRGDEEEEAREEERKREKERRRERERERWESVFSQRSGRVQR